MSKIGCICGHVIYDQTDNLPYKARILRHQDEDQLTDYLIEVVQSLIEAVKSGTTEAWINQNFLPIYPRDLPAGHMIHDLVIGKLYGPGGLLTDIYECEICGRLLVKSEPKQGYPVFAPESGKYERVLQSKRLSGAE